MGTEIVFESNSADRELIASMAQAFTAMQLGGKKTFGSLKISEIEFDMKCEIYVQAVCDLCRESQGTIFGWQVSPGLILATAKSIASDPKVTELPDCAYFALLCRRMYESRTKVVAREVLIGGIPTMVGRRISIGIPQAESDKVLDSIISKMKVDKPLTMRKPKKGDPTVKAIVRTLSLPEPAEQTEEEARKRRAVLRKQALA